MKRQIIVLCLMVALFAVICYTSCIHKSEIPSVAPDGGYPNDVAAIMLTKCAITGCHNQASYVNANGLLLDTWEHLFDGGTNGAVAVAYCPTYSPLLYVTNTDSTNGELVVKPTMPFSSPGRPMAPLTKAEYKTLYDWVASGAPDKNGNIPFASNPDTRQKIYLTQSGSDMMAVIDGKKRVVMRYFTIGMDPARIENAHEVEFSSDGRYAYAIFYNGSFIQKIDATLDRVVGYCNVNSIIPGGNGAWSIVCVAPNDTMIAGTNWQGSGGFATINANTMTTSYRNYYGGFSFPHGITSNEAFDTFFITSQFGNVIYKFGTNPVRIKQISLNGKKPNPSADSSDHASPNPHQIEMLPDYSKYYVTCQGTNEVRVVDAHTDKVLDSIPVGAYPQEMAISESRHLLFVTCLRDQNAGTQPACIGSVYVIDYTTDRVVKVLNGDFYEPHDLCVDEQDSLIYIASTNQDGISHCVIPGGGKAGWYTVYNLNTLEPADNKRYLVLVYPYAMNSRF